MSYIEGQQIILDVSKFIKIEHYTGQSIVGRVDTRALTKEIYLEIQSRLGVESSGGWGDGDFNINWVR